MFINNLLLYTFGISVWKIVYVCPYDLSQSNLLLWSLDNLIENHTRNWKW